ncbi:MAG TPA: hypothetical protein VMT70_15490 [Vicinamibacteria bacterium]|nr:hypothetical protein [Vicinamibacteria bacterium]
MPSSIHVSLGGLAFELSAGEIPLEPAPDDAYRSFLLDSSAPSASPPTHRLALAVSRDLAFRGQPIFRSSATWSILARDGDRALEFRDPAGDPLYVATFRPGSPDVRILCSPRLVEAQGSKGALSSPFRYPLDQVLTMYLLGGTGVVLHAAGALVRGKGIALAGASGAGKSTFMRLAAGRPGWEPLSDDRVILRRIGGSVLVCGTPWSGEGQVAENRRGPAARLLFLEQAGANGVRPLGRRDALARLVRTASVPWYDREYVGSALDACGRIVDEVPSAALSFRPEPDIVDIVERLLDGEEDGQLAPPRQDDAP